MLQAASATSVAIGNGIVSNKLHSASEAQTVDDQKDLEVDREETVEEEEKAEIDTGSSTDAGPSKLHLVVSDAPTQETAEADKAEEDAPSEQATFRGLSARATQIGEYLRTTTEVTALLLSADGSSKEIPYDTSSTQTRSLLKGRASIAGSVEGLNVIIARSLDSSGEPNQHALPGAIEGGHRGDYLLFRVDAEGNAANLSLSEYQSYAAANPSSKQRRVDAQRIRARPQASNLVFVRSEIDRAVRAELESGSESEISAAKQERFQAVVDRVVAACASSPMEDPDYDDSAAAQSEAEEAVDQQIQTDDTAPDSRHWRAQLDDALNFVRARGRADGQRLAQQISSTYFELNNEAPSQQQMADIFDGIRAELAAEAQQDLAPELRTATTAATSSSAVSTAQRLAPKLSTASPAELVEYGRLIVEQDLVQRARSLVRSVLGREGDDSEVRETLKELALKLAEAALDAQSGAANRSDSDADADYNPENAADARLHRHDTKEDRQHDADFFEAERAAEDEARDGVSVRTSATTKSRTGAAEAFSVYFDEGSKRSNLQTALRMFARRNGRAPTQPEQARLRRFLATQEVVDVVPVDGAAGDESKREEEAAPKRSERELPRSPQKVLVTPVRRNKAQSAAFNVYFEGSKLSEEAEQHNERIAVQWFKRFSGRAPDDAELHGIRRFTKTDRDALTEQEYVVPTYSLSGAEDDDADEETAQVSAKSSSVVTKPAATSYTLQFDGDAPAGDEKLAMQWFERFNKREPTAEDRERVNSFLGRGADEVDEKTEEKAAEDDDEETIDID